MNWLSATLTSHGFASFWIRLHSHDIKALSPFHWSQMVGLAKYLPRILNRGCSKSIQPIQRSKSTVNYLYRCCWHHLIIIFARTKGLRACHAPASQPTCGLCKLGRSALLCILWCKVLRGLLFRPPQSHFDHLIKVYWL